MFNRRAEKRFSNMRYQHLKAHLRSADQLLMREYEMLGEALKKESDPIRRYRIISGMAKLEAVLEKRRSLMDRHGL